MFVYESIGIIVALGHVHKKVTWSATGVACGAKLACVPGAPGSPQLHHDIPARVELAARAGRHQAGGVVFLDDERAGPR